mgnify:CR=1 FL=1
MKQYLEIESVYAREILDSRGNPTIEVSFSAKKNIKLIKKNYKVIHLKTYIEERLFILTDKMWDQDNFAIIQVDAVAKSNWETQKVVFSPCVIDVFTIPVNEYKTLTPDYKLFNDILSLNDTCLFNYI